MASYVYRVHVLVSPCDTAHFPKEAFDLSKQTTLFKCERKAKNFIRRTIDGYIETGEFECWNPDSYTWIVDSLVTSARLSFILEECKVRT